MQFDTVAYLSICWALLYQWAYFGDILTSHDLSVIIKSIIYAQLSRFASMQAKRQLIGPNLAMTYDPLVQQRIDL